MEQLSWMHWRLAREMLDLRPAGEAGSHNDRIGVGLAHAGKQPLFTNQARDFVMLFLIAEGAGHAATAGVKIDHLGAGYPAQQAQCRLHADQGPLMTVAVDEDFLGARFEPHLASGGCQPSG